jgi:hypothetical protein
VSEVFQTEIVSIGMELGCLKNLEATLLLSAFVYYAVSNHRLIVDFTIFVWEGTKIHLQHTTSTLCHFFF